MFWQDYLRSSQNNESELFFSGMIYSQKNAGKINKGLKICFHLLILKLFFDKRKRRKNEVVLILMVNSTILKE